MAARPRIGLDGFNLALGRGTGVATYARVLSRCLGAMGHPVDVLYGLNLPATADAGLRETLFFDRLSEGRERAAPKPASIRWWSELARAPRGLDAIPVPIAGTVLREGFRDRMPHFDRLLNASDLFGLAARYFRLHRRFLRVRIPDPPAIMHWTYPVPVRLEGARNVYTLHDLVPLRLPHTTLDNKPYYQRLIRGCLHHCDRLCTVSDASLRDVVALFPEAEGRIDNTYESFDPPAEAIAATGAEIAAKLHGLFDLPYQEYFLFFGSLEPKKNIGRLIEAYLQSGVAATLVLVGAQAWKSEGELRLLKLREGRPRRPGEGAVTQIEYLPLPLLMTLIRGAKAVTFPSLYEGFGLPVLEAMALGTPVLTSNTASLPEIAGDAAVMVDPYDMAAIAEALRRLDNDAALRARLRAMGPAQAAKFSLEAYQHRMTRFYERVLCN